VHLDRASFVQSHPASPRAASHAACMQAVALTQHQLQPPRSRIKNASTRAACQQRDVLRFCHKRQQDNAQHTIHQVNSGGVQRIVHSQHQLQPHSTHRHTHTTVTTDAFRNKHKQGWQEAVCDQLATPPAATCGLSTAHDAVRLMRRPDLRCAAAAGISSPWCKLVKADKQILPHGGGVVVGTSGCCLHNGQPSQQLQYAAGCC